MTGGTVFNRLTVSRAMSAAGFDHFREAARFSSSAGPASREELAEPSSPGRSEQVAGITEVVNRQ